MSSYKYHTNKMFADSRSGLSLAIAAARDSIEFYKRCQVEFKNNPNDMRGILCDFMLERFAEREAVLVKQLIKLELTAEAHWKELADSDQRLKALHGLPISKQKITGSFNYEPGEY